VIVDILQSYENAERLTRFAGGSILFPPVADSEPILALQKALSVLQDIV